MKIALVTGAFPPEFIGGTERVVQAQAHALRQRGHDVLVVCGSQDKRYGFRQEVRSEDGIDVLRVAKTRVESSQVHWQFARLARIIDEATEGYDLVHLHHWAGLSGDLVRRLRRRVPVVVSLHDAFASCPRHFRVPLEGCACPSSRPTSDCARCVAPLVGGASPHDLEEALSARWKSFRAELVAASRVLTPSRWLRDSLGAWVELDPQGWEVVPHGLCQELEPVERPWEDGPLTVISFGNRARAKGTLDLVRAMAALPAGSARLLLLGAEVEAGVDAELHAAAGSLALELEGRYDGARLAQRAAEADIAAFPSRAQESYGLVVEEALALGLPVWVSDRGALSEVLADAAGRGPLPGGVLPAEDPAAWTRELQRLVDLPGRLHDARALVPSAPRTVESAVEQQLRIYAEVLQNHPVPGP